MTTFPRIHMPPSIEIIAALNDAYVPKRSSDLIGKALGDKEVTWVEGGHVSTLLLESPLIRKK